ncbi:HNH endonuclease [Pseudomonadales bacterium]|nr:HNH endonuclease [Pseudomonadales bacterium]
MTKDLAYYQQQLSSLRPDRSSGHAKPHKVCLLLAVMDLIQQNVITDNRIELNDALKVSFSQHFDNYKLGNDKDDPAQPFFYLESSSFWRHQPSPDHVTEYQQRISDRKHGGPGVVVRVIDYAYLDEALFDYLKSPVARSVIHAALAGNLDDFSHRFERWALGVGKSEKTIKNYSGAIKGSLSKWVGEAGLSNKNLFEINSYSDYHSLAEQAKKLEIFEVRDTKGKGMYSAALKLYGDFLADTSQYQVAEDIQVINSSAELDATEKEVLINTRIGQGLFRENLISYWNGCALTGYRDPCFLIASHIKPWRSADNSERLDTYNGVLLLPNLDKAFDLGFISFDEKGGILLSQQMENHTTLGIGNAMEINLERPHQDYMAYHREEIFRN